MFTEEEIKYFLEKAEMHLESNEYDSALNYYNEIIRKTPPNPHSFKRRALISRFIGNIDSAIEDLNRAIDLDPDDSVSYWERGACFAHKLSLDKNIDGIQKTKILKKILNEYKESIKRNPASTAAWLAIVETDMLLKEWDNAISDYGASKPYVDTKEYQLIRSWLGCISLVLAGDQPDEEDSKPLYDKMIKLEIGIWCVSEIESLFVELDKDRFNLDKMLKAKEIHGQFISHYDEPPIGSTTYFLK